MALSRRQLYGELILACALWGSQHPLLRMLSLVLPAVALNASRFAIAVVCLAPFAIPAGRKVSAGDKLRCAVAGVFGVALYSMVVVEGVRRAGAVHFSLITNIHPFLSTVLAPVLIREQIRAEKILASVIGFFGAAIIITSGFQQVIFTSESFIGDLFLVSSAFIFSLYTIYAKPLVERCGGLSFTFFSMAGGTATLGLGLLVTGEAGSLAVLSISYWAALLYIAVFTVAIAWWLWFRAIGGLGVSTASIFVFTVPLVGVCFAATVFGEQVSAWTWIGGAFIMLALFVNVWRDAVSLFTGGKESEA